jgi:DNA-binding IclR family transcriptional regulator
MTTLTPPTLGHRQLNILDTLKQGSRSGMTAPQLRDALGFSADTYGTQQMHATLRTMQVRGLVTKEAISQKVALKERTGTTGRPPTSRYKITADGRKALKAAG